jgi:hypothetical protein
MAGCSSGGADLDVGEGPLVYVVMGNSLMFRPAGSSVSELYESMLVEDFGVEIDVRDHFEQGSDDLLFRLENVAALRSDLQEADVITFIIPNGDWEDSLMTFTGMSGRDPSDCGGDDGEQCLRDMISDYQRNVDQIFAELMTVVDPAEQVVLVQDFYQFFTDQETASTDRLYPYWRDAQTHVQEVAESYGIPVAFVWDDFMGTDGEIPNLTEAGLVEIDGIHPTEEGAARIANLYRDLGYPLAS